MGMYIHHIDRFDPLTEAGTDWIDRRRLNAVERYKQVQRETKVSDVNRPAPEDKIEFIKPQEAYRPEQATLSTPLQETIEEARRESSQQEKVLSRDLVMFRTHYKGGIGINFDVLA